MKFLAVALLLFLPSHTVLPPLPTTAWSIYGPVPVLRQHPTDCGGAIGCYHPLSRQIVVDDSIDAVLAWRVFEHERYHVMARDLNAHFTSEADEQVAANVYANYRVMEMLNAKP